MARIRAHRNNRYATTFNKSLVALTILSALHGANAQEQDDQEKAASNEEEVVEVQRVAKEVRRPSTCPAQRKFLELFRKCPGNFKKKSRKFPRNCLAP